MLDDPIFKNTFIIVGSVFAFILILTIYFDIQKRKQEKVKGLGELWLRYITFLFIAPTFLIPAYLGRPVFNFLIMGMAILYLKEFFNLTQIWQYRAYRWEVIIFTILVLLVTLVNDKSVFLHIPVLIIICVLITPIFLKKVEDAIKNTTITIVGILYFGWMFSYAIFLRDNFGFGGILFVCFLATIDDLSCFWIGKAIGKNKLIPEISPNKTVEGSLGGIIITVIFSLLLKYGLPDYSYLKCVLLGFVISITGQLGDLVLSVMKRDMQVKDAGTMLPGHGGMLDRFTSWIFTLPIAYYVLNIIK